MRKEVLWAVIAGIILGLIVAFGVWRINSTISGNKKEDISLATPTPEPGIVGEFKVVLDKPGQNDVVTNKIIAVSGLTKPLTWVTFSGESGDYTIQSDKSGTFSQDVDLIPGVNQIIVTAFESKGAKSATEVLVIYSSSFQTKTVAESTPGVEASGTSDIRQKVAQDVADTLNRPKAYIGTVTDITDSTIEIKTAASEIKQISVNSVSTSVINSTGVTSKTVKVTDIAIGDFIVAMGYVNGNSVLSAQRILITNSVPQPKIIVSEAKVATTTKKSLTVNTIPDNKEDTVTPNTKTKIETVKDGKSVVSKLSDIDTDDLIIYVVTTDSKGVASTRSIFVVNPPQG